DVCCQADITGNTLEENPRISFLLLVNVGSRYGVAVAPGIAVAPRVAVAPGIAVAPRVAVAPGVAVAPRVAAIQRVPAVPEEAVPEELNAGQQLVYGTEQIADQTEHTTTARTGVFLLSHDVIATARIPIRSPAVVLQPREIARQVQSLIGAVRGGAVHGIVRIHQTGALLEHRISQIAFGVDGRMGSGHQPALDL